MNLATALRFSCPISFQTTEIPPGTLIRLTLNAENALSSELFSTPVVGTLASGTALAIGVDLAAGITVIDASATWTAPEPETAPANVAIVRFSVENLAPPAVPMLPTAGLAALGLLLLTLGWRLLAPS